VATQILPGIKCPTSPNTQQTWRVLLVSHHRQAPSIQDQV